MKKAHLSVNNLTVKYGELLAVDSLNFELKSETVVFFGPSGCGKTSILKAILGVYEPSMKTSGTIELDGMPIEKGNGEVGMTFQGPVIPTWLTVFDLCRMGCKIRCVNNTEQRERIMSMLKLFNIAHLSNKFPKDMSGGEKQRAALAITLLNEPKVLLLDEPTTFIDGVTRISIWNYLEKKVYPLGIPTIVVSHDPTEAITLGDKIYVLSNPAKIVEEISVPFPHPRVEEISKNQNFFEIRHRLIENNFSIRAEYHASIRRS